MKKKYRVIIGLCLVLILFVCYLNWKYEVIAFHPFRDKGEAELRVMTWNVHCSIGAERTRQQAIAELILGEGADLVLLNEYNQDSCMVMDSKLREKYPYAVERNSHQKSGDIIFSKRMMTNTGRVYKRKDVEGVQITKATTAIGTDSVQIFGIHMASNHYDDSSMDESDFHAGMSSVERYKKAQEQRCFQAHWTKQAVI